MIISRDKPKVKLLEQVQITALSQKLMHTLEDDHDLHSRFEQGSWSKKSIRLKNRWNDITHRIFLNYEIMDIKRNIRNIYMQPVVAGQAACIYMFLK